MHFCVHVFFFICSPSLHVVHIDTDLRTCSNAVPNPCPNSDSGAANACKSLRVRGLSAWRMEAMGHLGSSIARLAK